MKPGLVTLAASAVCVLNAHAAWAATGTVAGDTLTIQAAPGEVNAPRVSHSAGGHSYRISDASAPLTPGAGCTSDDDTLTCSDAGVTRVVIDLGDGDDKWESSAIDVVPQVDGGEGDDILLGRENSDDDLDGGPGEDRLVGFDGNDILTGGAGLDRIDASGAGKKTVDCQGRDDEIIKPGPGLTRVNCSAAPKVTIAAVGGKPAKVIGRKYRFKVTCDRPCAVYWELRVEGKARKQIHHPGGWIDRGLIKKDADGFPTPFVATQTFTAGVAGLATKKALARFKSFDASIYVQAFSQSGLDSKATKKLKFK